LHCQTIRQCACLLSIHNIIIIKHMPRTL
jgi:hypothetical protein